MKARPACTGLAALLLTACTPTHRIGKFFAPEQFAMVAEPRGALATVTVASGWENEPPTDYTPEPFTENGVDYERPVPITEDGWINLAPQADGLAVSLATRHGTADFQPLLVLTGGIAGRVPNEIRPLPSGTPLNGPWRLSMSDLVNVYAPDPLQDGDLLLVTVADPSGLTEHYLLREQDFGFRTRFGAGVLVRLPVPFMDQANADLSPALAATLAVGYRPRIQRPGAAWLADQVALVGSVGIGSTAVDITGANLEELQGAFNAALVGGGVELLGIVSGQVLFNVSSLTRRDQESPVALAVGFDAVQLARFTKNGLTRLFRTNALESPPLPEPPE